MKFSRMSIRKLLVMKTIKHIEESDGLFPLPALRSLLTSFYVHLKPLKSEYKPPSQECSRPISALLSLNLKLKKALVDYIKE